MGESKICGEMIASRSINCMEEAYVPLVLYEDREPTLRSVGRGRIGSRECFALSKGRAEDCMIMNLSNL